MGAVLGSLAGLGYGYAYRVLDCRFFGLAQRRPRVFIVGSARDWAAPAEILLEPERRDGDTPQGQEAGPAPAADPGRGPRADGAAPDVASTIQGGGRRGYRIDAEGAAGGLLVPATVPAITARTGEAIADSDATSPLVVGPLTTKDSVRGAAGGGIPIVTAPVTPATARFGDVGDTEPNLVVTARGEAVAYPLTSNGADATEDGTGRGTPLVAFDLRQITSPGNRSNPAPGDPAPTMATDSKQVVVGASWKSDGLGGGAEDLAGTLLSSGDGHPGHDQGFAAVEGLGVRRLTPLECERLQGYPDGWTAGQSDSARYRELGNAVPVPVPEWIAGRLVAVADREGL
jgi:DNA (cytosine-5)-methyltransferase 1